MSISRYLSIFADFLNSSGVLGISGGGTGLTSTPSNGQLDIGNGTGFTRATLTAGTGISVTNGAGSVTIAATGGGTVTSITAGTGLSGGTITTSGTIALVTTAGAVGTYAFLKNAGATDVAFGSTTAGSNLRETGIGQMCGSVTFYGLGTAKSGTWQSMGYGYGTNTYGANATLWVRIA